MVRDIFEDSVNARPVLGVISAATLYSLLFLIGIMSNLPGIFMPLMFPGLIILYIVVPLFVYFIPNIDFIVVDWVRLALVFWLSAIPWLFVGGLYGSRNQNLNTIAKGFIILFILFFLICGLSTQIFFFFMEGSVLDN